MSSIVIGITPRSLETDRKISVVNTGLRVISMERVGPLSVEKMTLMGRNLLEFPSVFPSARFFRAK